MMVESQRQSSFLEFYKLYVPDHSSQRLHIPPAFIAHLNAKTLPHKIILRNRRSGRLWHIEVSEDEKCVFFHNGWQIFITDYSLELGDLLTFRFDGSFIFDVTVFGKSNCEKEVIDALISDINKDKEVEEDNVAIEVEKYVQSKKNPYFVTKIRNRNRARLYVPVDVLRDHNIQLNHKMMILRDPNGKNWIGKVAAWKDGRIWIGGWKAFCKWNNVGKDDKCICEFVQRRGQQKVSVIQIHIVRTGTGKPGV